MLAGAVALAAGRFQPLVRLDPSPGIDGGGMKSAGPVQADPPTGSRWTRPGRSPARWRRWPRSSPARRSAGRPCDFLTLAGDWPYPIRNDVEDGKLRGEHALDDLVGRAPGLAPRRASPGAGHAGRSPAGCWAIRRRASTGHVLAVSSSPDGGALEHVPRRAVLVGLRHEGAPGSSGQALAAVDSPGPSCRRLARRGGLAPGFRPGNRFGWIMVNSSGEPAAVLRSRGARASGRPASGKPGAVSMIHSFSAADPADPSTIAGRWLENGAYVYFGAMNEPYLQAFRPPKLVAELAAAEIPLGAVAQAGGARALRPPMAAVYLGDPLYQMSTRLPRDPAGRMAPRSLQAQLSPLAAIEIQAETPPPALPATDAERLKWCLTYAIRSLCRKWLSSGTAGESERPIPGTPDWRASLLEIDRSKLASSLRTIHAELLIDTMIHSGGEDRLRDWLLRIPPEECPPRLWRMIETTSMSRLAKRHMPANSARLSTSGTS